MKKILRIPVFLTLLISACSKDDDTDPGSADPTSVFIYSVVATPTDQESITVKNNSGSTADLSGWSLGDNNDPDAYNIPSGTILSQGSSHTFPRSTLGFQINDSGETLYLKNSSGSIIDIWTN